MSDELKPCPKCESEDVNPIEAYVDEGLVRITCNECGFTTGAESDEETASAAWNTLFMMTAAPRSEVLQLRAFRDSVPWATLIAAIWFVRKHANGSADLLRKLDEVDTWLAAHAPKEPTK